MTKKLLGPNNSLSQKFRVPILIAGIILCIANLWTVNYDRLLTRENLGEGLGIFSNLLLIAAMVISLRHTANKRET